LRWLFLLLVTLAMVASDGVSAVEQPAAPAGQESLARAGKFTVVGSKIYGPDQRPFVARGANVNGYNWVWQRDTADDAHLIVDCWQFNTIRVNSYLFLGRIKWDQYDNNNNLDRIIDVYSKKKVVVIIEMHDFIGKYYEGKDLDELEAFYVDLAKRTKDNPYVWFDIMNEPDENRQPNAEKWIGMHQRIIRAIRATGNDNIILVEGSNWGQEAGTWDKGSVPTINSAILSLGKKLLKDGDTTFQNIVFSVHVWEQWNYGDDKLADYLDRVQKQGLALIIGEYGGDNGDNRSTRAATISMFKTAVPRGIGRIVWHWNGDKPNILTQGTSQGGGWQINNCRKPTNLSWMGKLVWKDNHETQAALQGQGGPLTDTPFGNLLNPVAVARVGRLWENFGDEPCDC
jgi:hypothetical protein